MISVVIQSLNGARERYRFRSLQPLLSLYPSSGAIIFVPIILETYQNHQDLFVKITEHKKLKIKNYYTYTKHTSKNKFNKSNKQYVAQMSIRIFKSLHSSENSSATDHNIKELNVIKQVPQEKEQPSLINHDSIYSIHANHINLDSSFNKIQSKDIHPINQEFSSTEPILKRNLTKSNDSIIINMLNKKQLYIPAEEGLSFGIEYKIVSINNHPLTKKIFHVGDTNFWDIYIDTFGNCTLSPKEDIPKKSLKSENILLALTLSNKENYAIQKTIQLRVILNDSEAFLPTNLSRKPLKPYAKKNIPSIPPNQTYLPYQSKEAKTTFSTSDSAIKTPLSTTSVSKKESDQNSYNLHKELNSSTPIQKYTIKPQNTFNVPNYKSLSFEQPSLTKSIIPNNILHKDKKKIYIFPFQSQPNTVPIILTTSYVKKSYTHSFLYKIFQTSYYENLQNPVVKNINFTQPYKKTTFIQYYPNTRNQISFNPFQNKRIETNEKTNESIKENIIVLPLLKTAQKETTNKEEKNSYSNHPFLTKRMHHSSYSVAWVWYIKKHYSIHKQGKIFLNQKNISITEPVNNSKKNSPTEKSFNELKKIIQTPYTPNINQHVPQNTVSNKECSISLNTPFISKVNKEEPFPLLKNSLLNLVQRYVTQHEKNTIVNEDKKLFLSSKEDDFHQNIVSDSSKKLYSKAFKSSYENSSFKKQESIQPGYFNPFQHFVMDEKLREHFIKLENKIYKLSPHGFKISLSLETPYQNTQFVYTTIMDKKEVLVNYNDTQDYFSFLIPEDVFVYTMGNHLYIYSPHGIDTDIIIGYNKRTIDYHDTEGIIIPKHHFSVNEYPDIPYLLLRLALLYGGDHTFINQKEKYVTIFSFDEQGIWERYFVYGSSPLLKKVTQVIQDLQYNHFQSLKVA